MIYLKLRQGSECVTTPQPLTRLACGGYSGLFQGPW